MENILGWLSCCTAIACLLLLCGRPAGTRAKRARRRDRVHLRQLLRFLAYQHAGPRG